jgi:hypothetical protein
VRLEILVGPIASGKTTYARKRADEGALVISHDDLTAMLHARYRYEQELRECYRGMEEDLASRALRAGRDVVIDRTHLTRESRCRWINFRQWYRNAPDYMGRELGEAAIVAVAFPIFPAHVHATRRVEADPRGRTFLEWHKVALHHAEQARLEPLELSEGFDRIEEGPDVTEARP